MTVELTEYQLKKIFEQGGKPDNFMHIDFELDPNKEEMDDVSDENMKYLLDVAEREISRQEKNLDKVAELLFQK
jgi:hypothetical protein